MIGRGTIDETMKAETDAPGVNVIIRGRRADFGELLQIFRRTHQSFLVAWHSLAATYVRRVRRPVGVCHDQSSR
jgi:hypothetical protein